MCAASGLVYLKLVPETVRECCWISAIADFAIQT
jgi:hypothetical protein